jgi:hypothetical protein
MKFFTSLAEDSDYNWFWHAVITRINPNFSLVEMPTDILKKMFDKAKVCKSIIKSQESLPQLTNSNVLWKDNMAPEYLEDDKLKRQKIIE